jgi:Ser/Thr protein kinase RdoA (MazF antagonist)
MSLTVPSAEPGVIPAPPDRELTVLPTALSPSAMEEVIGEVLGSHMSLRGCVPEYIRYKPETSCIVQYRLSAEDAETGLTHHFGAYAKLFAGDRAARAWAKGTAQRLAATAAEWSEDGPRLERAAYLRELGALLQVYPVDIALPALAFTATPAGRDHVVERLLPASPPATGEIELIRYKPARKALLRYETADGPLYVKLHATTSAELLCRATEALAAASVPLVAPLGCLSELNLLAHAEETGTPLHELCGTVEYEAGARAAGEALARLHAAPPPPDIPLHTTADQATLVADSARTVARLRRDLGDAVAVCAERIIESLAELPPAAAALHGDFYDDQVLVRDDRATLLDLDGIRLGHPLVDAGNFLAHVTVRELGEEARAAFLEGYGLKPSPALDLMEAAALLRLAVAPFRRLAPDWPAGVEQRLGLVARLVGSTRLSRRLQERRLDPVLPQLALLRNRQLVEPPLSEALGERVRVDEVVVVRHKYGRRCTLRYTLTPATGGEPLRVYAKTFASERGPRVFRALEALVEGWSRPPAVVIPEPVAYVRSCKLLLQREVPGASARSRFLAGDRALAMRAAEALAGLHRSGARLERVHTLTDELAAARSRVERLEGAAPRARRCLAKLEAALAAPRAWRERPVHRDFYHDQLLLFGDALGILDFDDAKMSEPAVDVANFLAHLRLLAIEEPGRAELVDDAAEAFRERAHALDPSLDPDLVRLLESATLLRLAGIHLLHAERLVERAEALLPSGGAVRARSGRPSRTELALDGLAVLGLVADAVEGWAGDRPTECRPVLLRRKRGRAVVRYDLVTERAPVTVVGKWFAANGRSGLVAETLAALRRNGFADGTFAVPEPIFHDAGLDLLVTDFTPGPNVRSLLDVDPAVAGRAGAWLARFHACDIRLPGACRPRELPATLSGLEGELARLAARVGAVLEAAPDPARPLHLDYSSTAVLVPENGPTVGIDLDDATMGDPAFDVANFEATLRLRGWRGLAPQESIRAATAAFREGYARQARLPLVTPAMGAAVWLRLAHRTASRGIGEDVVRFAVERTEEQLKRSRA